MVNCGLSWVRGQMFHVWNFQMYFTVLSTLVSDSSEIKPCLRRWIMGDFSCWYSVVSVFNWSHCYQESLWRHGVVHDPAKKKQKVWMCPCLSSSAFHTGKYSLLHLVLALRFCPLSRNYVLKRISPGVWHRGSDWQLQPIRRRPTSLLRSCKRPL